MPGSLGVPVGLCDGDELGGGPGSASGSAWGGVGCGRGRRRLLGRLRGGGESVTCVTSGVTLVDGSSAPRPPRRGRRTETSPLTGAAVAEVADHV